MAEDNEIDELATEALKSDDTLASLIDALAGSSRRSRQHAAAAIAAVARKDVKRIAPYSAQLNDALNRPEARTRWECLDAFTLLVDCESRLCDKAVDGAEASLFDEDNGQVRLSAMRFLCKIGSTTPTRSEKVWPLIDEGIQCYHGDVEFNDMLTALVEFSQGKLSDKVKNEFADRMRFDASNGKGILGGRAKQIVENLEGSK